MSVNSHGTVCVDNLQEKCLETQFYGPKRVKIALYVVAALEQLGLCYCLEGGNLVGAALRKGKMLPHDDDFDFALYVEELTHEHSEEAKNNYLKLLKSKLDYLLPGFLSTRCITTYCKKLEVFDEKFGSYEFSPKVGGKVAVNTNYHNVTCDLMLLLPISRDSVHLQQQHSNMIHHGITIHKKHLFPLSHVFYEGHYFKCPNNSRGYLSDVYGCLEENVVYDHATGKYVKNSVPTAELKNYKK